MMALRADSYSTVAEVTAFTRHLLGGQSGFNAQTHPTLTEVEKYIDRASGYVNVALNNRGFTTPVSNSTGKLVLDDWVTQRSVEFVEYSVGGRGYEGRGVSFDELMSDAEAMIKANELGFKRLGVGVTHKASDALSYTGLDSRANRSDKDDADLAQPLFRRNLYSQFSSDDKSSETVEDND
jgi:hypothetical protein